MTTASTFLRDDATFAHISGTTTNDNAAAGDVGEIVESDIPSGSPISLTTSVVTNVTSISLSAGDWDIAGICIFSPAATTTTTAVVGGVTATSATFDATNGRFNQISYPSGSNIQSFISTPTIPCRFSLATTTTIYLVADAIFATSTMIAFGHIRARRAR